MRYEKSQALLRLAIEMQATAEGVTLQDIMAAHGVSRRTAERMRDAVCQVFPQVEEFDAGDGFKRWRVSSRRPITAIPVTTDELTALHSAAETLRRAARDDQADMLGSVSAKLRSLLKTNELLAMEPDYEAMAQAEGLVFTPGPRPRIDPVVLAELREAIKGPNEVDLLYRARFSGEEGRHKVQPYGFLYGSRHYLVARLPGLESGGFRLFSLSNIGEVNRLESSFTRQADFSLEQYAANSFGVYQETPFKVVWRISPDVADDARTFLFHPTQEFEEQADGSLILRFEAGGLVEMAWHLFTWEGEIQALEPPELLETIRVITRSFVAAHPIGGKDVADG
ncbi:MAG: WYL domain-containing protein [Magnetospirillum sp.]|nr:WYL domain-containing protein [Magnetospirillum sp.]